MTGIEPVQAHFLAAQRTRAAAVVESARAAAQDMIARAQSEAAALVETAEREGESSAELDTTRAMTSARRRARGIVLAAQRDAYDHLRSATAQAIRANAGYSRLLEHVADLAQRRLGPGTEVVIGAGEIVATRKRRQVRWSLDDEVERVLGALGSELAELWR